MSVKSPLISKGDPVIPQEVRDEFTGPEDGVEIPTLNNWRRYDRGLWGEIISLDGSTTGKIDRVPGLMMKMIVSEGWVVMDTGQYYRLGNRAYAGT